MTRLLDWLTLRLAWIGSCYTPHLRAIGAMRIAYALILMVAPVTLGWTTRLPDEFYDPGPGLPALIGIPPSSGYVTTLIVLHYATAVWLLVGWRTRTASAAVVIVGLLEYSLAYSFGKVDHSVLFQLVPVVMAFVGWGAALSFDARRAESRADGMPLVLWSVVIAFAFATAALAKASAGWWSPGHYGARAYAVDDLLFGSTTGPLVNHAVDHLAPAMWKLIDLGTLFAEGWLVIAIFAPVLFRIGVFILIAFHVSVYLVLGIDFSSYVFVYLPFFLLPPRTWFRPPQSWGEFRNSHTPSDRQPLRG